MTVLVTGAAGFIGYFTTEALLRNGHRVVGYDSLNAYYDPALKKRRLDLLLDYEAFTFVRGELENDSALTEVFRKHRPQKVIHLAAQAGVRHSIDHPRDVIRANVTGFINVLEGCRETGVEHLVFASSSSVYGLNTKLPFSVGDGTDSPASLYGASKKANELMAHSYAHLFGLPATGLRLFTVYGPWGRPDMAPFIFTKNIVEGRPIDVYNNGNHARDFTYIDDIVDGILRIHERSPPGGCGRDGVATPFRLYNIGNNNPVRLLDFIACIEEAAGKRAKINFMPMQQGDVLATYADIAGVAADTGFSPSTPIAEGIPQLVRWYLSHYPQG